MVSSTEEPPKAEQETKEIEVVADDIATTLANILINAFKVREGRDPTNEEIQDMFEELTEERINEMLGLGGSASVEGAEVDVAELEGKESE